MNTTDLSDRTLPSYFQVGGCGPWHRAWRELIGMLLALLHFLIFAYPHPRLFRHAFLLAYNTTY
jgi:hypothetical protein